MLRVSLLRLLDFAKKHSKSKLHFLVPGRFLIYNSTLISFNRSKLGCLASGHFGRDQSGYFKHKSLTGFSTVYARAVAHNRSVVQSSPIYGIIL